MVMRGGDDDEERDDGDKWRGDVGVVGSDGDDGE